jgi:hypothetical protein
MFEHEPLLVTVRPATVPSAPRPKTTHDRPLGLRYGPRLTPFWSWSIALLLVIGSIRGIIVLNSTLSPATVYQSTAACLVLLACYGYLKRGGYGGTELALLKKLLQLNLVLGILNIAVDLVLGAPVDLSVLYVYLAPYVIFVFLRVPVRYLHTAILIISAAISYSVCDNFIQTLSGPEGLQRVYAYNTRLRPDVFEQLSRTGEFFRAGGYTGSYHDSANILGMTASFLFIRFLLKRSIVDLGLFLLAIISLTLTQSAANIVIAVFSIIVFAGYTLMRSKRLSTFLYLMIGVGGIVGLTVKFGHGMAIFAARVGEEGDWSGIATQLDASSLLSAVPFALVGHATAFGSGIIHTEIGLLKGVFQLGIVHATILYWLTLFPVFRFAKVRTGCSEALPAIAAVSFGFLSLLHYGSLHRVTNVFLFYAFFAIGLVHIINCTSSDGELGTSSVAT